MQALDTTFALTNILDTVCRPAKFEFWASPGSRKQGPISSDNGQIFKQTADGINVANAYYADLKTTKLSKLLKKGVLTAEPTAYDVQHVYTLSISTA